MSTVLEEQSSSLWRTRVRARQSNLYRLRPTTTMAITLRVPIIWVLFLSVLFYTSLRLCIFFPCFSRWEFFWGGWRAHGLVMDNYMSRWALKSSSFIDSSSLNWSLTHCTGGDVMHVQIAVGFIGNRSLLRSMDK